MQVAVSDFNKTGMRRISKCLTTNSANFFTEAELKELFEHSYKGLSAQVEKISIIATGTGEDAVKTWCVEISGIFRQDRKTCGEFQRTLSLLKGQVVFTHKGMKLASRVRGQRAGRGWVKECLRRYQSLGVQRVEVWCCSEGSYVWAELGFNLSAPIRPKLLEIWKKSAHTRMNSLVESGHLTDSEYRQISERFLNYDFTTI